MTTPLRQNKTYRVCSIWCDYCWNHTSHFFECGNDVNAFCSECGQYLLPYVAELVCKKEDMYHAYAPTNMLTMSTGNSPQISLAS